MRVERTDDIRDAVLPVLKITRWVLIRRVAEKILALKKAQALEGRLGLPRSHVPRLGDWLKKFLASIGHPKTKSRYESSVRNILRHFGEHIRLLEITPELVFDFQQKRLAEGVGKATVNRDLATLSSALTKGKETPPDYSQSSR